MEDTSVNDYSCNGKCSNCGGCCVPYLPITNSELATIKEYVLRNNINPISIFDGSNCYIDCVFHDRVNKKCTIYPVRPEVCRQFLCCKKKCKDRTFASYYDHRAEINGSTGSLKPLDLLIYNNPVTLLMIAQSILGDKINEQSLIRFLNSTHNEDVAKAIENKEIILEWSE